MRHKEAKEVSRWLRRRLWFNRYKRNIIEENESRLDYFLSGNAGMTTLSAAFIYRDTPEGNRYWVKRERRFLRWYYYQNKEILRCKWFAARIGL